MPLEPHPWNTGFAWRPGTGGRALGAAEAAAFDRDGFLVRDGVVGADELARVVAVLDAREEVADAALRALPDERLLIAEAGAITFAPHLVGEEPALRALARHPGLVDLCADLIGPDVDLYWDQAVYKKPDKPRRFPWHQDNGYRFVEPQQYLTCWLALTDATEANGCPVVVPGVHTAGTLRHGWVDPLGFECFAEPPAAPVPAPVGAGGVVVFSSLTPHLTGPNTTSAVRKAYILQYAPADAVWPEGDPDAGPPTGRTPCADPVLRFPVLRAGRPVHDATEPERPR